MSAGTLTSGRKASEPLGRRECRVYERFASDLPTQCQPLAARGDNEIAWPGTLRNISAGGIGLVLQRRFEPRSGLAVELPDLNGSSVTVFVRVIHATAQANGTWLLGCSFVSPLSEERLSAILFASNKNSPTSAPAPGSEAAAGEAPIIQGVHFRAVLPDGSVLSRSVTRLHVTGDWPLPPGRIITAWVGKGKRNGATVALRVNDCHEEGGHWFVDCTFVNPPPPDMVRSFNEP